VGGHWCRIDARRMHRVRAVMPENPVRAEELCGGSSTR
jgi:hypothetical protein